MKGIVSATLNLKRLIGSLQTYQQSLGSGYLRILCKLVNMNVKITINEVIK